MRAVFIVDRGEVTVNFVSLAPSTQRPCPTWIVRMMMKGFSRMMSTLFTQMRTLPHLDRADDDEGLQPDDEQQLARDDARHHLHVGQRVPEWRAAAGRGEKEHVSNPHCLGRGREYMYSSAAGNGSAGAHRCSRFRLQTHFFLASLAMSSSEGFNSEASSSVRFSPSELWVKATATSAELMKGWSLDPSV